MVTINPLVGSNKIKDEYTKINTNFTNLNNGKVEKTGDTITGVVEVSRALAGGNKNYYRLTAPDGKTYDIAIRTDGSIAFYNATDGVTVARFGPTAEGYIGPSTRIATLDLFVETQLFFGSTSTGTVTLSGSVNDFPYLLIVTGGVATGDLRTAITRGWDVSGFRVGTDFINVSTSNGKFVAQVTAANQISITQADDPLRQVYGLKYPVGWM